MEGRVRVAEGDLLEALRALLERETQGPDDAYTTQDLVEATGWPEYKVRRLLKVLLREGVAETTRVRRPGMDLRNSLVSAYRLRKGAP